MTIDILVKIYKKWGEDNNLENLGSADEELIWRSNLTQKQTQWLEKFIRVWDKIEDEVEGYIKYEEMKGKN
tara:strand:+ start:1743 stop:1955 length:213 start_codon:yes stop_codon:yes gene_type:complete